MEDHTYKSTTGITWRRNKEDTEYKRQTSYLTRIQIQVFYLYLLVLLCIYLKMLTPTTRISLTKVAVTF